MSISEVEVNYIMESLQLARSERDVLVEKVHALHDQISHLKAQIRRLERKNKGRKNGKKA